MTKVVFPGLDVRYIEARSGKFLSQEDLLQTLKVWQAILEAGGAATEMISLLQALRNTIAGVYPDGS